MNMKPTHREPMEKPLEKPLAKQPMDRRQKLTDSWKVLRKIFVPVELFETVTVPILAALNTISEVINDMAKEDGTNADHPVQLEETKPGND